MTIQPNNNLYRPKLALRLRRQLEMKFGHAVANVDRALKFGEDRGVWLGEFDGKPVVFKTFQGLEASQTIKNARAELRYLEANLEPPYFANKCIAAAPDIGVIVLSLVPGQHAGKSLFEGTEGLRDEVLQLAGGWLDACTSLRSRKQELRPGRQIGLLRKNCSDQMNVEDQKLITTMFADLVRQSGRLKGRQAPYAVAHSDFKHENIHYSRGEIHAVDIQKALWLPVARKAARFLVMKDLTRKITSRGLLDGLDGKEAHVFLNAVGQERIQSSVFRFFVGEQMARTFLKNYQSFNLRANAGLRACARNRMRAYVSAPRGRAVTGMLG